MKATEEQLARVRMMADDTFGQCESDCKALAAVLEDCAKLDELKKVAERIVEWMDDNGYSKDDQSFGARAALSDLD